jgi:hypothetical protein
LDLSAFFALAEKTTLEDMGAEKCSMPRYPMEKLKHMLILHGNLRAISSGAPNSKSQ